MFPDAESPWTRDVRSASLGNNKRWRKANCIPTRPAIPNPKREACRSERGAPKARRSLRVLGCRGEGTAPAAASGPTESEQGPTRALFDLVEMQDERGCLSAICQLLTADSAFIRSQQIENNFLAL